MIAIGSILLVVAMAVALFVAAASMSRERWQKAASRLGLEVQQDFLFSSPRLRGQLRGFDVEVFQYDKAIGIDVHGVDPGFTIRRDSAIARMIRPDIETGDPEFDQRCRIEGDEDFVFAVLDYETRNAINLLVDRDDNKLSDRRMLDLAERLRRPTRAEVSKLLSKRAIEDPHQSVCLRAFRRLASGYYRSDELRETARALRDSQDISLQVEACRVLLRDPDTEGAEAARKLMGVVQRHADPSLRRRALEAVAGSAFYRKDYVPAMAALLGQRDSKPSDKPREAAPELRPAALQGLVKARALDELLRVELSDDPDEAVDLARGLRQIGDVTAQPRLFELLRHSRDRVRAAAAEALGDVGDVRAVEELRKALDSRLVTKLTMGRAAESAIDQIKSRLGGSQAGEISLAKVEPLEGAVSPSDADFAAREDDGTGGEVSLTR